MRPLFVSTVTELVGCDIISNMIMMLAVLLAATNIASSGVVKQPGAAAGGDMAKITSASTYYDRKEGFAYFNGNVFVDDAKYKLHADKAYVFMSASNDLQRIVALGNVAITNESKRAYGAKASYYRNPGMVVLYSGENTPAEVRDETSSGNQVVRGKKIKFWINSEQVEVLEAELSAPAAKGSIGGLDGIIRR